MPDSEFPFNGAVLDRLPSHLDQTIDFNSDKIQSFIDEKRDLARKFIYNLNQSEFIDNKTEGITEVTYPTLYGENDKHLFGVGIQTTVPVTTGKTFC